MFPVVDEINIPKAEEFKKARHTGKSFLYDFDKGEFVLQNGKLVEVTGIEALKVWIEKIIRTGKFRFRIYENTSEKYGVTVEDLFSSPLPRAFVESELKRELTESLLTHSEIRSLEGWQFEYKKGGRTSISFTVELIDNAFDFEVVI
ncbi:DUF2634 domain-containing protein [Bacillus manliponensis]|uniref:DUF2634 domain-containing protein n=1 Tax=Bacillus manliponensis TaxID=574376 RepID=UPI003512142D